MPTCPASVSKKPIQMSPAALKAPTCAAGSITGGVLDSAESRLKPLVAGCLMPSMLARSDPLEVIVTSLVPKMPAEMLCRIFAPSEVVVMLTDESTVSGTLISPKSIEPPDVMLTEGADGPATKSMAIGRSASRVWV